MRCSMFAITWSSAALVVATAVITLKSQTTPASPAPPNVTITDSDLNKTIRVKKGDVIEVRLLAGLPSYWFPLEPMPALRNKLKYPRSEAAPRTGETLSLDGRYTCVNLFEVVGESDVPVTFKLTYCAPPREAERLAGIKPKDPTDLGFWTRQRLERKEITPIEFRPGLPATELKEGMAFEVKLQTKDQPTQGPSAAPVQK